MRLTTRRPDKKVIVSRKGMNTSQYSPTSMTSPTPPRRTPVLSGRDVSSRLSSETAKTHVKATAIRRKSNIVSIKQVVNVKTYRTMEARSRVSPNGPPPRKIPLVRKQEQPRRAVEDRTSRGLINEQAQGMSSIPSDEVGKERRDYTVANKINDALLTSCSPEALATPISPDDSPAIEQTSAQHSLYVINDKCQTNDRHLPTTEAARKQSEVLKAPCREGAYLARARRMSRNV